MKSFLLSVLIIALFSTTNLYSQDIKAKLKGHLAVNGFTVVDDLGNVLFRVTGEGSVGINTDTPTGFLDVQGGEAINDQVPLSINLIAKSYSDNLSGDVLLQSGGGVYGSQIKLSGGIQGNGGDVDIISGDGGNHGPGDINIISNNSNTGSGKINIQTMGSNAGGGNITIWAGSAGMGGEGEITLKTSNSSFGGNNRILLSTGKVPPDGNNSIEIRTGENEWQQINDIILATGNGTQDGKGGDIVFSPGTGTPNGLVIINGSGTYSGTWTMASDERFKKNIEPIHNAVDKLEQINGVSYEFKSEEFPEKNFSDRRQIGLIAQEVEKVFPELVKTDAEGYKSVAYQNMVAVLLEAVKEQQKSIDELKKEVEGLKNNQKTEVSTKTNNDN